MTLDPMRSLRIYVFALTLTLASLLVLALQDGLSLEQNFVAWAVLTALFFTSEYGDLYFHDERARLAVSPSEAILIPMFVALTFEQVLLGVVVAITAERLLRRVALVKTLFNVASFGCAAGAAAAVWEGLRDAGPGLSPADGVAVVAAVGSFAALTHIFTSIAIALAEQRSVIALTKAIGRTTLVNLVGSILLGLFLGASFLAAPWTIVLFPIGLFALYLANRGLAAQAGERQRVEHLHAATRALVSRPDLPAALLNFLREVRNIASAAEARAVLQLDDGRVWSGIRSDVVAADMSPLDDRVMSSIADHVSNTGASLLVAGDEAGPERAFREGLGASSLIAVPLSDEGGGFGCLIVLDRLGADAFQRADVRLLEALANELTVSLGSYKLFAEVAEERERFGRIFAGSKEGICLIDSGGRVKAWNPALERITGYVADEVMDRVWSEVILVRDATETRLLGDELIGVEPDEELELVTKGGPSRWVTLLPGPVGESEDGGRVVLVRDVSAEHEVEAAKSDFLSTISHELRTPLTSIKGSLQVLGRGLDTLPNDIADQMISVTSRGAERLERLVMNLLVVSQLDSGTMAVFPDEVSLNDVVRDRVEALLSDHPTKRVELPEEPILVRADRERVAHVLEHLLENARKFGGPHGTIVVAARLDSDYARVSISDEGPGIAEADQRRVFERFVRLGNVLTRETQGAGVGLFIAKASVEAMGGQISVDSEPGKGSTFTMMLPLAKPMALSTGAGSA